MEILELLGIVILIALLMWRKVDIGVSLLIGAAAFAIVFKMPLNVFLSSVYTAVKDTKTIEVVCAVVLIISMGKLMKQNGSLTRMVDALDGLIGDRRISMVIPPAFIGLLPAPGGAMLSAPMVDETGSRLNLNAEQKTYINFWFRHLWEYCWPLYPGLIIGAAIINRPVRDIIIAQYPITLAAIVAGIIFGLMPIKVAKTTVKKKNDFRKSFLQLNISIWPIWFILIGLIGLHIGILVILSSIVMMLLISYKGKLKESITIVKSAFSWKILLLLFSVMIFKQVLMDSSAVEAIPQLLETSGISPLVPIFMIPFIMGLLTGVNQAYIGVSFPLLLPFFGSENIDMKLIMFAYCTGFAGVLISPVHLCLLLTKEYFHARWAGIYKQLLPSALFIIIASYILMKA